MQCGKDEAYRENNPTDQGEDTKRDANLKTPAHNRLTGAKDKKTHLQSLLFPTIANKNLKIFQEQIFWYLKPGDRQGRQPAFSSDT